MINRKIWLGIGTAVWVAAPAGSEARVTGPDPAAVAGVGTPKASIELAQHKGHEPVRAKARGGGEGGEGGEAGPAKARGGGEGGEAGNSEARLARPLKFYRDIELIRGHYLIGAELVEAGRWEEALPHFLHPQEEIYDEIKDDLRSFKVPPFLAGLKSLAQTVKAKNKEAFAKARAAVEDRLAAAEKAVRTSRTDAAGFAVDTVFQVLRSATEEYGEALKDGRIANVVEYQDARGFVHEADRLFGTVADELSKKDAQSVASIRASLAEIKAAFPSPTPPERPVKDAGALLSSVSGIELQLGRLR